MHAPPAAAAPARAVGPALHAAQALPSDRTESSQQGSGPSTVTNMHGRSMGETLKLTAPTAIAYSGRELSRVRVYVVGLFPCPHGHRTGAHACMHACTKRAAAVFIQHLNETTDRPSLSCVCARTLSTPGPWRVRRTAGRDLAHNAARSRYAMRWYWASSYIAGVTRWSMHDVNQHVQ